MINYQNITKEVTLLTQQIAQYIAEQALTFSSEKIEHKGLNDLVSYVDKTAEMQLVKGLQAILPEAAFITEENTIAKQDNDLQWIVDPLDGTTNFMHGLPCYSISIALMHKNELVVGVVHEVNRKECFYAWKDGGAFLNGNPISVSAKLNLQDSLIATGFPYTVFEEIDDYLTLLKELMKCTHGLRRLGSAAVDLAYVAAGRFDAYFEYNLNAWDVAAGCLLVKEAGGQVTDFKGGEDYVFGRRVVASNKSTHIAILTVIQSNFKN
jgi:myo-inositol-1(or 4)-monophosphatase